VSDVLPISVVVPTIGRASLLSSCLESIARCRPGAADVVVVDQSADHAVRVVVDEWASAGARLVTSDVRDRGHAVNLGMQHARNDLVLVTDDDCTVSSSWIESAWLVLEHNGAAIVTGRVLPEGDEQGIPSTIVDEAARDYTGHVHYGALFGGNMGCDRNEFLAFGGFDVRVTSAEDNDFCYRWLRAGRTLVYEPAMQVWHHGWRSPDELKRVYVAYGRGQGLFYGKHLRSGDLGVLRFLLTDVYRGLRGTLAVLVRGEPAWPDARVGLLRGLGRGLPTGLRLSPPHGVDQPLSRAPAE
jgi:GT2 family glycosyltransferase